MKTLQDQYNLIKEGKGNKQQFFKSARHLFPDLITPVNSFNDAVNILKNRGVISEMFVGGGVVTKGRTPDWFSIFNENMDKLAEAKEAKAEEKETTKEVTDMATRGYDYKDTKNIDNIFGTAFLKGFYSEMQDPKNEGKTVEELKQIVAKNMAKDCLHYVKNSPFGVEGGYTVEAPGLGESKPAKGPHKSSGYGDLKESVLRSQIHLLVKEVLAEENKDLSKHRLGVLKAALADAEKEIKKVDKDGKPLLDKDSKAFKDWEKTIAAKKREIEALEKEVLDEVKQPELKAALDAADEAYDENKYDNVDDFLKTYKGKYKNEVENALKSKYEG